MTFKIVIVAATIFFTTQVPVVGSAISAKYIVLLLCYFQTNTSVANSLGPFFFPQISVIFLDMLTVYRYF